MGGRQVQQRAKGADDHSKKYCRAVTALAMDSIAAAHSGHMGLPLGSAEVGSILYGSQMTYNPTDPT